MKEDSARDLSNPSCIWFQSSCKWPSDALSRCGPTPWLSREAKNCRGRERIINLVLLKNEGRFVRLLQGLPAAGSKFSEAPLAVDCEWPAGAAVGCCCLPKPQQHCRAADVQNSSRQGCALTGDLLVCTFSSRAGSCSCSVHASLPVQRRNWAGVDPVEAVSRSEGRKENYQL